MNTITKTASTSTILAIDLGKYKRVAWPCPGEGRRPIAQKSPVATDADRALGLPSFDVSSLHADSRRSSMRRVGLLE